MCAHACAGSYESLSTCEAELEARVRGIKTAKKAEKKKAKAAKHEECALRLVLYQFR